MKYFDQHVHSEFSFDSKTHIRKYVKRAIELGLEYFVITDHCDENFNCSHKNITANYKAQKVVLDKLQKKFPNIKIQQGIEVGYQKSEIDRINKIINDNDFDLINLSIHCDEKVDLYRKRFFRNGKAKNEIQKSLELAVEAVDSGIDFDVLSHLDYAFKTAHFVDKDLKISEFEGVIRELFTKLIQKEKALEINTKVQSAIKDDEHVKYILRLYKEMGGKYLTLSSDAHKVSRYCYHFDKYLPIIKECGFSELTIFVHRKKVFIKI